MQEFIETLKELELLTKSNVFNSEPYNKSRIIYHKSQLTSKQRKLRAKAKRAKQSRKINRK